MSWQLCKGTSFSAVEGLLHRLKDRLVTLGCSIGQFHIDNCCQWRAKLQSVFGNDTSVKLDPFHAIQRFTSKIPRKWGRGSALRKLRSRLIIRDPTDQGKTRKKPTPCKDTIEKNIKTFLEQWKDVDYERVQLVPQCALDEIDKLLLHVRNGCLSIYHQLEEQVIIIIIIINNNKLKFLPRSFYKNIQLRLTIRY